MTVPNPNPAADEQQHQFIRQHCDFSNIYKSNRENKFIHHLYKADILSNYDDLFLYVKNNCHTNYFITFHLYTFYV